MRAQKSGVIAHFGSVGSWGGAPAGGLYCATKWAISGVTEALYAELAPFGINAVIIEPGYFRTGFLNPGARLLTETRMDDYEKTAVGQVRAMFEERNNKQAGDVEKGARVIFEVLTKKDGKEIPMRLALGSDAYQTIGKKCDDTKALLEEWKDVIESTDHDVQYY
jgi:NAD(P)-dependent dehydrogenase (short-subunit alcohol dehydrogenase family)